MDIKGELRSRYTLQTLSPAWHPLSPVFSEGVIRTLGHLELSCVFSWFALNPMLKTFWMEHSHSFPSAGVLWILILWVKNEDCLLLIQVFTWGPIVRLRALRQLGLPTLLLPPLPSVACPTDSVAVSSARGQRCLRPTPPKVVLKHAGT